MHTTKQILTFNYLTGILKIAAELQGSELNTDRSPLKKTEVASLSHYRVKIVLFY